MRGVTTGLLDKKEGKGICLENILAARRKHEERTGGGPGMKGMKVTGIVIDV